MMEKNNNAEHQVEGNVVKLTNPQTNNVPKKSPKNVHAGHRARLRNRFINNGLDSFEDHNALELFLFYAIPNRDVNDLAHNLINEFGSISAVFDANFEDLCKVKGISDYSASLIKLLPALAKRYEQDKFITKSEPLDTIEKIAEYMSTMYYDATKEVLYFVCLDNALGLVKCIKIAEGDVGQISASFRKITEEVLKANAYRVVIVHNHLSNVLSPSPADIMFTTNAVAAMKSVGIKVYDHIIMGRGKEFFSMRSNRKWNSMFIY